MIPFSAAYDWFLKQASPIFSLYAQELIHDLAQAACIRDKLPFIYALDNYAETQALINEKGEISVFCAVFYHDNFLKDDFHYIVKLFNRALVVFEKKADDLNQALVYCMLYHLYSKSSNSIEMFTYAHQALSHFLNCSERFCSEEARKQGCVYLDQAKDIAFNLVSKFDFTYSLLNEFEESRLSPLSIKLTQEIDAALRLKDTVQVEKEIHLLIETARRSSNVEEVAEAYCFCAQKMDWLKDIPQTIKLLKSAVAWFFPDSHKQLFARWMLALYQMQQAQYYHEAVTNFETVISGMDALITMCDRQNHLYRRLWYEAFAAGMSRVLVNRINFGDIKGLGSDPFFHTPPRPGRPRLPPGTPQQ